MPGMLSPCIDEVGDISAPVDINKMFLKSPDSKRCITNELSTDALQPQPEPPE